jgi:ABC-type multidrug transport system ATPase subunit
MSELAISASGIRRNYGRFEALKIVSFKVPRGSVFGFLGPNGAGKTTTLYVLLGLLPQKEGFVDVLGFNPVKEGDALRARIGCLLEEPGLYETLSVKANLEFFGRAQLMKESAIQARIKEMLEFFELSDFARTRAGKLSKGMKQKCALARAMLTNPDILFLDEPTANLDPEASIAFRDLVLKLARRHGTTVFLNTHRLDEAQRICDHIAIIKKGVVHVSGSTESLLEGDGLVTVRIKASGITDQAITKLSDSAAQLSFSGDMLTARLKRHDMIPGFVRECVDAGLGIYGVSPDRLSLEELFMEVMEGDHVA